MTDWPIPSDGDQVRFLKNIQRLLNEGSFVASYKFALLHSLADLAVEFGDDSGAPLDLTIRQIAERFIRLYWQQVRPFQVAGSDSGIVLKQNTGRQADVINRIAAARVRSAGSLYRGRMDRPAWKALVSDVATTVRVMPLWKLQTVGSERLDFLYDNIETGASIMLKPGMAYCFRAFYPVLCGLFRSSWIDYLRRANARDLGYANDLQDFLFGHERASLDVYVPILRDVQRGECFYCRGHLRSSADVDHFIPWSRCHSDLAHNFVLAHRGCNSAKSDHLAFEKHLEAWAVRNADMRAELNQRFDAAAIVYDLDVSRRIASWAYAYAEQANSQVWIRDSEFKRLDGSWRAILVA
ncbi:MAG: HNH endonuclease [Lentisphaerae bacterium]|nr:HNH endonuclease [Lentisphaerota bacterium]